MKLMFTIVFTIMVLISCQNTSPTIPKDARQGFILGCLVMMNQIALSSEFTDEQYEYLFKFYKANCLLGEKL